MAVSPGERANQEEPMATMNTQPVPARRRADASHAAADGSQRAPAAPHADAQAAADAALADLFPALRLRQRQAPARDAATR
jgi:hypothetical protein